MGMESRITLLLIVFFIIVGIVKQIISFINLKKKLNFTEDYREKLITLVNTLASTRKLDNAIYYNLTESVIKMQQELGEDGILAQFEDKLTGVRATNYQYLINFLPSLRNIDFGNSIILERYYSAVYYCDDMFVRHIGCLKDCINCTKKSFFNPFLCFSFGVRVVITLPVLITKWFGFMSDSKYTKILQSGFITSLNMIITISGFVSSIISITIGWNDFIKMISSLFNK